jgi:hypothetical protein
MIWKVYFGRGASIVVVTDPSAAAATFFFDPARLAFGAAGAFFTAALFGRFVVVGIAGC